jgi:hypothetical protein
MGKTKDLSKDFKNIVILHKTLVYCVLKKCIVFEKTQIFRFLIKKLLYSISSDGPFKGF